MLAEQAGNVPPRGREAVIEGRGDQHLDDRLRRPALAAGIEVGSFHVAERRRDDDARGVMIGNCAARQAAKIGQLGQSDVHAEGTGTAAVAFDAAAESGRQHRGIEQLQIQQPRIQVGV